MILQLLLILVLTGVNAFFAAAEMALVSVDRLSVESKAQKGNKKATKLLEVIDEPNGFLATIQVGITLAGFLSSASAATGMSEQVGTVLGNMGIPYSDQIAVIVITLILSYFILVFGELLPKQIALGKAESVAFFVVEPIRYTSIITYPFVKLLTLTIRGLMKLFGIREKDESEDVSEERIRMLVSLGRQRGTIEKEEEVRINRLFEFNDKTIDQVMIDKDSVFSISNTSYNGEGIRQVISKKLTRIPVLDQDTNQPVGILLIKDLLSHLSLSEVDDIDVKELMHQPFTCSKDMALDTLFLRMQKARKHMAIVMDGDDYLGIVTIEDLIEQVFGDIEDEFDA